MKKIENSIKGFIRKRLDKYRYRIFSCLKAYLLRHELLEKKREFICERKVIAHALYDQALLSKKALLHQVFVVMSNELYKNIQHANRYSYLPKVETLHLEEVVKTRDADVFIITIEMYYSVYGYMEWQHIEDLSRAFSLMLEKMLKYKV